MRWAPKRRGPVIAVVVALVLLASPLVVVASASVNPVDVLTREELAALFPKEVDDVIVGGLEENALSFSEAASLQGFGWVLGQFGLGDGIISDQLAGIRTQLNEIQDSLNRLEAATAELRTQLDVKDYEQQVREAGDIIAPIDAAGKDLDFVAHMSRNDPDKKAFTEATLNKIQLLVDSDAQGKLALRTKDLIAAAYKVALDNHRLWTQRTSLEVRAVFGYYESAETRLLLLRVEYMHAKPLTYTGKYVKTQIEDVREILANQRSLLKPEPGEGVIADTRTDLEWFWGGLRVESDFRHAETFAADVGSTGLFPVPTFSCCIFGMSYVSGYVYHEVGKGWRLPPEPEVLNLIAGWSDPSGSWLHWLNRETGGQIALLAVPHGVWTSTIRRSRGELPTTYRLATGIGTSGEAVHTRLPGEEVVRSPFLVRTRTSHYW